MTVWFIKGNCSSGKLGEKEKLRSLVMAFSIVCILFPYHGAAKKLQHQDKETEWEDGHFAILGSVPDAVAPRHQTSWRPMGTVGCWWAGVYCGGGLEY